MNEAEIFLGILAIAMVATDIAVRLVIAPHRRDVQLGELLGNLIKPTPATRIETVEPDQQGVSKTTMKRQPFRLLIRRDGSL